MKVKIKINNELLDATIEMIDGMMVVSQKEEKFEPKDGDVCRSLSCIYIFKTTKVSGYSENEQAIVYHLCYNIDDDELFIGEDIGVGYISRNNRLATEEEKKLLFDKLNREGYEWDAENKELIKLKWKPELGEVYYYPSMKPLNGRVMSIPKQEKNTGVKFDKGIIDSGWVFRTKEECQAFCDKLNEAINQVKP